MIVTAYPRIHFDVHLRQHKKHTVCLFVVLKATEMVNILGVMIDFCYIERGLLRDQLCFYYYYHYPLCVPRVN